MRVNYQVCIDCADPHLLADFWSAALGWIKEEHHDQIKRLLEQGLITENDVVTIDGRMFFKEASAVRDPEAKIAPDGLPERGRLLVQVVPEGKVVKNRVHLDVRAGTGLVGEQRLATLEAECARLVAIGAVHVRTLFADEDNESCIVMQDIEGDEFCLD